jgi:hypothetical protein
VIFDEGSNQFEGHSYTVNPGIILELLKAIILAIDPIEVGNDQLSEDRGEYRLDMATHVDDPGLCVSTFSEYAATEFPWTTRIGVNDP